MRVRNVQTRMLEALGDTPCVLLAGARQVGKSTLAEWAVSAGHVGRYVTLDTAAVRAAAASDPEGFIDDLGPSVAIDEVQRVPEILLAIKRAVDRRRRPGSFLLTGSADVRMLPTVTESLAGRMETIALHPFSQGELAGAVDGFVDAVLADELPAFRPPEISRGELLERVACGAYPEAVERSRPGRRREWFAAYIDTVVQREVSELADIEGRAELPDLLTLLAARSASMLNLAGLGRDLGIAQTTLRRYYALLRAVYLLDEIPAWSTRDTQKIARSPKTMLNDSGLAAHLLHFDADRSAPVDPIGIAGRLTEAFVLGELRRQIAWSHERPTLRHFRSHAGAEVDAILEARGGRVVGIEVKLAASLSNRDLRGLRALKEASGRRFVRGIVLYTGSERVAFADDIFAMPISALWTLGARAQGAA